MVSLGGITEAQVDQTFNLNVHGLIFTLQKALPFMHQGGPIILNALTASSQGHRRSECIAQRRPKEIAEAALFLASRVRAAI